MQHQRLVLMVQPGIVKGNTDSSINLRTGFGCPLLTLLLGFLGSSWNLLLDLRGGLRYIACVSPVSREGHVMICGAGATYSRTASVRPWGFRPHCTGNILFRQQPRARGKGALRTLAKPLFGDSGERG